MRKSNKNIALYLLLIVGLWAFCFVTLKLLLMPYSIAYTETGKMTAGYFCYAAIGLLFSTPAPFISVLIIALFKERIKLKKFLKWIFQTENKLQAIILTGGFCLLALLFALINGTSNGSSWVMFPLGCLIMIPFVGIAEETGWRGFGITVFIWAFALAALYKATKSVIACAIYHSFMDAIGAVYDWNLLFDTFPGTVTTNIYRIIWLGLSVALWIWADRKEKQKSKQKDIFEAPGY